MSLLAWIVLGLVAGLIAMALVRRRGVGGRIAAVLIGEAGALLGGWLATLMGFGGLAGGLDLRNLAVAAMGAILLLILWRLLTGREG